MAAANRWPSFSLLPVAALCAWLLPAHARLLPGYYNEAGLNAFRTSVNAKLDEHVDPFTGTLQLHHVDAVFPGNGGFDLLLQRSYTNPMASYGSSSDTASYNRIPNLGIGWTLLFGGRLLANNACQGGGHQMVLETPDGHRQGLVRTDAVSGVFLSPARWKAVCTGESVLGSAVVNVFSPDGREYRMAQPIAEVIPNTIQALSFLYPTRITDRNGNTATLSYGARGTTTLLESVTTSDNRSISLSYGLHGSVYLLTGVYTSVASWSVYYSTPVLTDLQGKGVAYYLTSVTPPSDIGRHLEVRRQRHLGFQLRSGWLRGLRPYDGLMVPVTPLRTPGSTAMETHHR